MKLSLNKEDILLALQSHICETVGKDMMIRSIEYCNSKGEKMGVNTVLVDFVKEDNGESK